MSNSPRNAHTHTGRKSGSAPLRGRASGGRKRGGRRGGRRSRNSNKMRNIKVNFLTVFFEVVIGLLMWMGDVGNRIRDFFGSLEVRTKIAAMVVAGLVVVTTCFFIIYAAATKPNGIEVYLNNSIIGVVKLDKHADFNDQYIMTMVTQRLEQSVSEKVQCYDTVTVVPVKAKDFVTPDSIITEITKRIKYRVQAAVITVDGERKAIMKNESEAKSLLDEIKNKYFQEGLGIVSIEFVETADVIFDFVDDSQWMTYSQAKIALTESERIEDLHVVVSGENLSTIRSKYDMSEESILAMNPGMNKDLLKVGQTLKVTRPKPVLSVRTVAEVVSRTSMKYETIYQDDNTRPRNYESVLVQGKDGIKEITERIIRINGTEESREVVREEIVDPPKNQVIVRGTN